MLNEYIDTILDIILLILEIDTDINLLCFTVVSHVT